jgi:hypothetical protein
MANLTQYASSDTFPCWLTMKSDDHNLTGLVFSGVVFSSARGILPVLSVDSKVLSANCAYTSRQIEYFACLLANSLAISASSYQKVCLCFHMTFKMTQTTQKCLVKIPIYLVMRGSSGIREEPQL